MKNRRALLFRLGTIMLLVAICAVMMVIGRGHTVYFDNKGYDFEGQSGTAPYKISIYVKGEQVAKLYDDERGMATWIGQNFKVELKVMEEKGGSETTETYTIKLPYDLDGVIINLPAFLAGLPEEAYLSEFVPLVVAEEEEEVIIDEFDMSSFE